MGFVHLHGHSQYSLLEGIGSVPNIIAQAQKLEMSAIAITDYHSMYGALEFYQKAKKAGIQAIIGVDMPLVDDIRIKQGALEHHGYVTLLCNNYEGYQDLLKLVSYANTTGYYSKPRIDWEILSKYNNNLTVLIGGELGVIGAMLTKNLTDEVLENTIKRLSDTMNGKIIIEYLVQDYADVPFAQQINTTAVELSSKYGIDLVCGNNYHYIHQDEQQPREVALAIKDQRFMSDRDRRKVVGHYHIMTEKEIRSVLSKHHIKNTQIDSMIETTQIYAEKLTIVMPYLPPMFPSYNPPSDIEHYYHSIKDGLIVESSS